MRSCEALPCWCESRARSRNDLRDQLGLAMGRRRPRRSALYEVVLARRASSPSPAVQSKRPVSAEGLRHQVGERPRSPYYRVPRRAELREMDTRAFHWSRWSCRPVSYVAQRVDINARCPEHLHKSASVAVTDVRFVKPRFGTSAGRISDTPKVSPGRRSAVLAKSRRALRGRLRTNPLDHPVA